jgi:hypothetical protein
MHCLNDPCLDFYNHFKWLDGLNHTRNLARLKMNQDRGFVPQPLGIWDWDGDGLALLTTLRQNDRLPK